MTIFFGVVGIILYKKRSIQNKFVFLYGILVLFTGCLPMMITQAPVIQIKLMD
jgi:hypothetical protein